MRAGNSVAEGRGLAIVMVYGLVAATYVIAAPLDAYLHQVDAMRAGEDTPFGKVEAECQRLLENYKIPEEQGRIFFMMAHVYAQTGHVRPEQSIKWAKKALEYPLDPEDKQLAYVYWGDAIQLSHRGVRGKQLAVVRREAVVPYLQGLKELLAYELPEGPSEPAIVESFDWSGPQDTPEYKQQLREYQAQVDAASRTRFVNRMLRYRDMQTGQIAYMYSRLPFATNELELLAREILKDNAGVDHLMARVKVRVQKRIERMGGGLPGEVAKDLDSALDLSLLETPNEPPKQALIPTGSTEDGEYQEQEVQNSNAEQKRFKDEYKVQNSGEGMSEPKGSYVMLGGIVTAMLVTGLVVGFIRRNRAVRYSR